MSEDMLMYQGWITILFHHVPQQMNIMEVTPNWKHHSNKLRKPKRNPVAIRQARARLQALKNKLLHTNHNAH